MHKYIEILTWSDEVVKRMDVTGKSDRAIDRIEDGMNINLNHDEYHTRVQEYADPQPDPSTTH